MELETEGIPPVQKWEDPKTAERAKVMVDLAAELQEASMRAMLKRIYDGTATSADFKIAMESADKAGLVLDPEAFPKTLKDKLTKGVDAKKVADGDADFQAGLRRVK
jgi:hypothetical protein